MRYEYSTNEEIKRGYGATNSFDAIADMVGNCHMSLTEACLEQAQGNCEYMFDEEQYDAVMDSDKAAKLYAEWFMEEIKEDGGDWIYDHRNECEEIKEAAKNLWMHKEDESLEAEHTDLRFYEFNSVYFSIDCGNTESVALLASSTNLDEAVAKGCEGVRYKIAA